MDHSHLPEKGAGKLRALLSNECQGVATGICFEVEQNTVPSPLVWRFVMAELPTNEQVMCEQQHRTPRVGKFVERRLKEPERIAEENLFNKPIYKSVFL